MVEVSAPAAPPGDREWACGCPELGSSRSPPRRPAAHSHARPRRPARCPAQVHGCFLARWCAECGEARSTDRTAAPRRPPPDVAALGGGRSGWSAAELGAVLTVAGAGLLSGGVAPCPGAAARDLDLPVGAPVQGAEGVRVVGVGWGIRDEVQVSAAAEWAVGHARSSSASRNLLASRNPFIGRPDHPPRAGVGRRPWARAWDVPTRPSRSPRHQHEHLVVEHRCARYQLLAHVLARPVAG
jgi:hypothetical protein